MGDMNPLLQKQKQLQEQVYKAPEQVQQTRQTTTQQQQQTSMEQTEDMQAIQEVIAANKYLQNERDDADAAEPDPEREELLARQMTIGMGKARASKNATDAAGQA